MLPWCWYGMLSCFHASLVVVLVVVYHASLVSVLLVRHAALVLVRHAAMLPCFPGVGVGMPCFPGVGAPCFHAHLVVVLVCHASLVLVRLRQRKAGQEAVACASSHQTATLAVPPKHPLYIQTYTSCSIPLQ